MASRARGTPRKPRRHVDETRWTLGEDRPLPSFASLAAVRCPLSCSASPRSCARLGPSHPSRPWLLFVTPWATRHLSEAVDEARGGLKRFSLIDAFIILSAGILVAFLPHMTLYLLIPCLFGCYETMELHRWVCNVPVSTPPLPPETRQQNVSFGSWELEWICFVAFDTPSPLRDKATETGRSVPGSSSGSASWPSTLPAGCIDRR